MRCYYYCDGYCFYHGDRGYVCDKIAWGTGKAIKGGYCPKETMPANWKNLPTLW